MPSHVALGLKARIGRAVIVAVGGDLREPRFVLSQPIALVPAGQWAPYHAAEGLPPAEARTSVERAIAEAHRLAASGIRAAIERCAGSALSTTARGCERCSSRPT